MERFYADTHTHTLASTHAYSTILENAKFASENGIGCIAMTDHAPSMPDAPHIWHFKNIKTVPEKLFGVRILRGVEADLCANGDIDMTDEELENLEWVIVSIHPPVFGEKRTIDEVTQAYIRAAQNPYVDVIGHSGNVNYPYDFDKAVKAFGEYGKLVEINEHTFDAREGSLDNCKKIALSCKKYGVRIVIGSDAHFAYDIGSFERSLDILEKIDFPLESIVNMKKETLENYLAERAKRIKNIKN